MHHPPGQYLENILEQPQVLNALVDRFQSAALLDKLKPLWQPVQDRPVWLTGMGASDSALWPLWFYLNQCGIVAQKIETSQLIHYLPGVLQRPGLLIAVSQSGESIEIRRLMEMLQTHKAASQSAGPAVPTVVSVTTQPDNFLAHHSDLAFHTNAGAEVGVATKTFTATLAVLHLLGRALTQTLSPSDFQALRTVVTIHQDVNLYASLLGADDSVSYELGDGRNGWVQVARGSVRLNGNELSAGDGVALRGEQTVTIDGVDDAEILLFDMGA